MKLITTFTSFLFAISAMAQVPNYIPSNGLLAWYAFNGNGADSSGNGNDLVNNNSAFASDRFGNPNASANLNGTSNYFSITSPSFTFASTDSFSYSFWMNKASQTSVGIPIMLGTNTTNVFISIMQSTNTSFQFGVNKQQSAWTWAQTTPTLNTWDNYIATYSGGAMDLYKNGALVASNTFTLTGSIAQNIPLYIGKGLGASGYFKGGIDDVAIWGRALSQQEIAEVYNSVITSNTIILDKKLLHIYPNPTNGNFILENRFDIGARIIIIDVTGREMATEYINSSKQSIDVTQLKRGIYFVKVDDDTQQSFKLILE